MKRLVIIAPNWLGDAVMAQPAIADLRRAFPDATISAAARPGLSSVFSLIPEIDETVPLTSLRQHSFEAALLLPNSFRSALIAYRAGIPERWGYRSEWRGPLLTRGVERESGVHQVESYRRLVAALGVANGAIEPRIVVPPPLREAGAAQLRDAGWDGHMPLVALAPGAAWGSAKQWPAASFAELAAGLAADGFCPVLVGGTGDVEMGHRILSVLRGSPDIQASAAELVLDLIGQNDIPLLAGVLANCRGIVSNDSGPMHLGAAVGLAVTVPFGPTNERLTRPLGDRHTVITNPVWCRPCMLRECPIDHRCMTGISVQTVAEAARRTL